MSAAEVVQRAFDAVPEGNLDPALVAPDAVFENVEQFIIQGPYVGVEGMHRWRSDLLEVIEGGFDFATQIVHEDDGVVVAKHRLTGRFRSSDLPADMAWYTVVWVRDGRLTGGRGCGSYAEAMELSRTPAPE